MRTNLPPIWLMAQRVRMAVEQAVKRFKVCDRHHSGADLRRDARLSVRLVRKAWLSSTPHRRRELAREFSDAVDDLKDSMQLAKDVGAFRSFGEFEALARLVTSLGQQCGGWLKELYSKGQNGQAASPAQRAPTLSSRTAPQGAQP
jgi:hypothetical protein